MNTDKLQEKTEERIPWGLLWALFFGYTAGVALLVQLVFLPYVFPAWHAGDGLLVGEDWLTFHKYAQALAEKIHKEGWSVWSLKPDGGPPVGVVGAVYALVAPKPWALIPINAALHASATIVLLRIVRFFLPGWRRAIWCVLPFLLFPSAMTWYTQIHKDGYSILGNYLFLYGWLLLAQAKATEHGKTALRSAACILSGVFLVWSVRIYLVQTLQVVAGIFAALITGIIGVKALKERWPWRGAVVLVVLAWVMVFGMNPFKKKELSLEPLLGIAIAAAQDPMDGSVSETGQATKDQQEHPYVLLTEEWMRDEWLPGWLDRIFFDIAYRREQFRTIYRGRTSIDVHVGFRSVWDVLAYVPRAALIAFLAPFPEQWFGEGSRAPNTIMRRIAGLEMLVVYPCLGLTIVAGWFWRQRIEMWMILFFSSFIMVAHALVVNNVGALYRFRYGYLMLLVALGIAGGFKTYQQYVSRRSASPKREAEA